MQYARLAQRTEGMLTELRSVTGGIGAAGCAWRLMHRVACLLVHQRHSLAYPLGLFRRSSSTLTARMTGEDKAQPGTAQQVIEASVDPSEAAMARRGGLRRLAGIGQHWLGEPPSQPHRRSSPPVSPPSRRHGLLPHQPHAYALH